MPVLLVFHRVVSIVQHVVLAEKRGEERNEGEGKCDKTESLVGEVVSLAHSRRGVYAFESSRVDVPSDGSDAKGVQLSGLGKVIERKVLFHMLRGMMGYFAPNHSQAQKTGRRQPPTTIMAIIDGLFQPFSAP
jgi:hypothetical protein